MKIRALLQACRREQRTACLKTWHPVYEMYLCILLINDINNNNSVKFTQGHVEESDVGDFETAKKMNENKLYVCQRPEGVPNNRILANLDLPRSQEILIWLNYQYRKPYCDSMSRTVTESINFSKKP